MLQIETRYLKFVCLKKWPLRHWLWSAFLCKCLAFVRLQSQLSPFLEFLDLKLKVVFGSAANKLPPYQIHSQTNFSPKKNNVGNVNMVLNANLTFYDKRVSLIDGAVVCELSGLIGLDFG